MKPPPLISDARVLEYAVTGEAVFTGALVLYVGAERLGAVPSLAICESLNGAERFLFHCDEDWNVLGIQAWKNSEGVDMSSVEEIKSQAEKYYAGISSRWVAHDDSPEDARAYQAYLVGNHCCSFCNRTMYEVDSLVEGNGGSRICNLCVTSFYEEMIANQMRG